MNLPAFSYHLPTAIEFGSGALARLPALATQLGARRALVVGDPGVERAGLVGRVLAALHDGQIAATAFTDVDSDPDVRSVEQGTHAGRAHQCDLVVGVGGGSALDTAKAVALMLTNEGSIRDYAGLGKVRHPGLPVVAIPTTAGTGSEVTIWSVLSDKARRVKIGVGSSFNCPRIALLDPQLSLSLPPPVTAATGMDALTHAMESYVNKTAQPVSEALALQAMKLIARSLRIAVAQGDNLAARSDMLLASTLAAMAFNSTRLGLVHALAMPLGAKFGIAHGLVNAIMLPAVMRFNLPASLEKYAEIARIFGEPPVDSSVQEAAEHAVAAIQSLRSDIGIRHKLGEFGVSEERFDEIVDEAMQSGNVPVNPRLPTREDMKRLLRAELA
jgi:alcohol dehydrogenase